MSSKLMNLLPEEEAYWKSLLDRFYKTLPDATLKELEWIRAEDDSVVWQFKIASRLCYHSFFGFLKTEVLDLRAKIARTEEEVYAFRKEQGIL